MNTRSKTGQYLFIFNQRIVSCKWIIHFLQGTLLCGIEFRCCSFFEKEGWVISFKFVAYDKKCLGIIRQWKSQSVHQFLEISNFISIKENWNSFPLVFSKWGPEYCVVSMDCITCPKLFNIQFSFLISLDSSKKLKWYQNSIQQWRRKWFKENGVNAVLLLISSSSFIVLKGYFYVFFTCRYS